jgi:NADPH:quinone reductase-like Zn-dependent oxidoreductase
LIKFKGNVVVPPVVIILAAVRNAYEELGLQGIVTVTSGNDSQHMVGSRHFADAALDFRTKHLTKIADKIAWAATSKKRLGPKYDVVLEALGTPNEHLHVEQNAPAIALVPVPIILKTAL